MYNLVSFSIFFNQVTLKFLLHPSNLPIKLFQVSRIYFQKFGELWNFFYRFNKIRLDFVANPKNYLYLQAVFWGLIRECVGGEVRAFHKDSLTYKYNALIVSNLVWLWGEFWWKLTRFFVIIICWKLYHMSIIWWIYLKGDFLPAGVICLLIISRISCKAGLSVKGWNYLYGEFYGKSCQIDDSEISLLFYHDALYVLYDINCDFIVIFMFLNYLL